jgi:hypothetical protein
MTPPAIEKVNEIAKATGFQVRHNDSRWYYSVSDAWPLWITAEMAQDGECVLYGIVRCRGQAGCRTDLNDWLSAIWTINLRKWGVSSPFLIDEGGFCNSDEIAARYILFDQSRINPFQPNVNEAELFMLFLTTMQACDLIGQLWRSANIYSDDRFDYGSEKFPPSLNKAFGKERKADICGIRSGRIAYYRRTSGDTSFTDFSCCDAWPDVKEMITGKLGGDYGESLGGHLVRTDSIRNVIPRKDRLGIDALLKQIHRTTLTGVSHFPCESHLLCVAEKGILARRVACGADRYAAEYILLRQLHRLNDGFLGQDVAFTWSEAINPARFESFIFELLKEDSEVRRIKQVGHSNEPDGGRDCIAEVTRAFLHMGTSEQEPIGPLSKIVVQCKVSAKNVGKASVIDIRDTVDQYSVSGFLLVAYPGITRHVLDYIEAIRERKLFWIEAWTQADIEAQLRRNLSFARRFPDVVTVLESEDSQSMERTLES